MQDTRRLSINAMIRISLITAIICILAPLSIPLPISIVPVSLTVFTIYIGAYAIGGKQNLIACILYILIGFLGVPVYAGFSAGPQKLLGPTGGFIIGFVAVAAMTGFFIDRFESVWMHILGMTIGMILCYVLGTMWFLMSVNGSTPKSAIATCVIPFILPDIIKIIIASLLGPVIKKRICSLR